MSRLDWFTIAVVVICLAAIIFLVSRMSGWDSTAGEIDTELQENIDNLGLGDDDDTLDPDNPDANTSGEMNTDASDLDTDVDDTATDGEGTGSDDSDSSMAGGEGEDSASDSDVLTEDDGFDEDAQVNTSPSRAGGDYLVIAGSFSLMHNAENFAQKLQKKGYSNAYVGKFNAGKFASVIVDSFDSSAEASAMVKDLKAAGIEAFSKRQK